MRRRLTPEARRAEIVEAAQAAIVSDGYRALSLSEIARRFGMSTPGLLHYFLDMPTLLEAVLDHRDDVDLAAIADDSRAPRSVLETLEAARHYYAARADEIRSFDTLEAEALDPSHPAHDYFRARSDRTFAQLRAQIDEEFAHPDDVARLVRLLLDGLRVKRLRSVGAATDDYDDDWLLVLDVIARQPRRQLA